LDLPSPAWPVAAGGTGSAALLGLSGPHRGRRLGSARSAGLPATRLPARRPGLRGRCLGRERFGRRDHRYRRLQRAGSGADLRAARQHQHAERRRFGGNRAGDQYLRHRGLGRRLRRRVRWRPADSRARRVRAHTGGPERERRGFPLERTVEPEQTFYVVVHAEQPADGQFTPAKGDPAVTENGDPVSSSFQAPASGELPDTGGPALPALAAGAFAAGALLLLAGGLVRVRWQS
jgi:hypothetical protein